MRDHPACNRPEGKVALLSGAARGTGASVVRDGILMRYALYGARGARGARQDPAAATRTPRCLPPRAGPASRTSRWPVNPAGRPAPTPPPRPARSSCTGWPGTGYPVPPALSPRPRSPDGARPGPPPGRSRRSARIYPHWGTPWPLPGNRTATGMQRCPRHPPSLPGRMVVASEDHFGWTGVRAVTVSNGPVQGGAVEPAVRSGTADAPVAPAARGVVSLSLIHI